MTLEEIDKLLADWKKKIDLVGQNLIDLHGLPTYQRLTGVSDYSAAQLTGVTQARLRPALEAMNDLFGYFDLLVKTVDQATQLRASIIPLFLRQNYPKRADVKVGLMDYSAIIQQLLGIGIHEYDICLFRTSR